MLFKKNIQTNGGSSLGIPFSLGTKAYDLNAVLNEPSVIACMKLIANTISSMPIRVIQNNTKIYDKFTPNLNKELSVILWKPNANETTQQLIAKIISNLVIYNEAFIQIKRDGHLLTSPIKSIECLNGVSRTKSSNGVWMFSGVDNANKPILSDEIRYLTTARLDFNTFDFLNQASSIIKLSNANLDNGVHYYKNKPQNIGWFSSTGKMNPEQMVRTRESLNTQSQEGGYGILEGLQFIPNTFSYKDSASFETQQNCTLQICSLMGVHPSLIGLDGGSQTLDEIRSVFMSTTINPLVLIVEDAINEALRYSNLQIDFEEKETLNSSYEVRSKIDMERWKLGLVNRNEARTDLPPLPADLGNAFVVESNNLTMGNPINTNTENNNK
ncbi:phage portal protein [Aeromonas caviae]|uniref:phage portal protein n=1 Tax=Aeromonas caviae TaxID=648 RepID=UPI0029D4989C|nr:phage portal protein [Aeromonas caviae]MDX7787403.1 phage portal protein [Aeromonas caviae]